MDKMKQMRRIASNGNAIINIQDAMPSGTVATEQMKLDVLIQSAKISRGIHVYRQLLLNIFVYRLLVLVMEKLIAWVPRMNDIYAAHYMEASDIIVGIITPTTNR
jgi:hypothetical protein